LHRDYAVKQARILREAFQSPDGDWLDFHEQQGWDNMQWEHFGFSPLTGIGWISTVVFPDFFVRFAFVLTCTGVLSASRLRPGGFDLTFRVIEHLDFAPQPGGCSITRCQPLRPLTFRPLPTLLSVSLPPAHSSCGSRESRRCSGVSRTTCALLVPLSHSASWPPTGSVLRASPGG
jgi:hypothetical protein